MFNLLGTISACKKKFMNVSLSSFDLLQSRYMALQARKLFLNTSILKGPSGKFSTKKYLESYFQTGTPLLNESLSSFLSFIITLRRQNSLEVFFNDMTNTLKSTRISSDVCLFRLKLYSFCYKLIFDLLQLKVHNVIHQ